MPDKYFGNGDSHLFCVVRKKLREEYLIIKLLFGGLCKPLQGTLAD
jgi:hypothetical protein